MKKQDYKFQMTLDQYRCGTTGRLSYKPHDKEDMPVFMHITGGSISVTYDAWYRDFASVADLHGIEIIIDDY